MPKCEVTIDVSYTYVIDASDKDQAQDLTIQAYNDA